MFWFALAAVASAASAAKNANAQNQASSLAYIDSLKSTNAQNDAILQANTANVIRTGYRVGLENLQKSRMVMQASQQGYDLSVQGVQAMGQNQAVAAASGTIGSSVDAVKEDIQKKQAETQNSYDVSFEQMMENAQIGIQQTIMAGQDSIQSSVKVNTTLPNQQSSLQAALISGASSFVSAYAGGKLSLGGAQPPAQVADPAFSNSLLGGIQGSYVGGVGAQRGQFSIQ